MTNINKAQDTGNRVLSECNENSKQVERITKEISNLQKNVKSLQENNPELIQHMLKCEIYPERKNVYYLISTKKNRKKCGDIVENTSDIFDVIS